MKKLLLSLLFALMAVFGLQAQTIWIGTADTSWYNATSTKFEISTAEQLAGLAKLVNNGKNFSGKTILLTADIVLNDTSDWENWESSAPNNTWTPIGKNYDKTFRGTFDGQGHTVSGIYINSENDYKGLFEYNEGTIKNIGVTESYIKGGYYVGGVCGYNESYGTISNCYNSGTVSGDRYVGGVCGRNNDTISNCYNSGTVSGDWHVGGVCGYNSGTISNCYNSGTVNGSERVGGVCGDNEDGTISNCYNAGTVSGKDFAIGGVCGSNDYFGTISDCYNSGNVSSNDYIVGGVCGSNYGTISNCYNSGNISGNNTIGGICGSNHDGTISNCYNSGTVSGNDYNVGGVCGSNYYDGTISNCYNSGTINGSESVGGVCGDNYYGTISDCYNTNTVRGTGETSRIGGVCGRNYGTISNCYNSGTVSGDRAVGGVCGFNDDGGTISNCYNSGTVNGNYYVGGVCGVIYDGKISNCYYLQYTATGGINGSDISGQAEVKTAEQFASGEVCWLLNEEQSEGAWGQKIGTDPCPVLGGPAVFKDGETYYNEEGSAIVETNSEQASFVIVPENLTINIYGSDHEATVYNLAGNIVYKGSERIIPVTTAGMYLVRIGNEVQKTVVR